MFSRIINGEDVFKAPVFDDLDGVALKSFLVVGERRMKKLIKFFKLRGVKLPSITKIQEAEKNLRVPIEETETKAMRIPLKTAIEKQCKESIEVRTDMKSEQLPQKLFVEACLGFDGAGKTYEHIEKCIFQKVFSL